MARIALVLGTAAGIALAAGISLTPAFALEPTSQPPHPPGFHRSPTDDKPVAPNVRRDGTSLYYLFRSGRFVSPSSVGAMAPASGGQVDSYRRTLAPAARYLYSAIPPANNRFAAEDSDGAPCATHSSYSLGALFACTLR